MLPRIPDNDKKAGVFYAVTDDGIELPIIDITNPAFTLQLGDLELEELFQSHLKEIKSRQRMPAFLMRLILGFMERRSILMRGITASEDTFMSGMHTYFMKLGADNLNAGYATNLDRQIAASLPVLSIRLRLQDIVHLLADCLTPTLGTNVNASLHLINIGGGPGIDSLNVLILLQKEQPGLLIRRRTFIHILDLDDAGPRFGARALSSLMSEKGPLYGLDIVIDHIKYDWSDSSIMCELVKSFDGQEVIVAASTEGALFEYGSDDEIVANLRTLHEVTSGDAIAAGTVTRADEPGRLMNSSSQAALKLRSLEAFKTLAETAGWQITKVIDRPLSHDILMEKA